MKMLAPREDFDTRERRRQCFFLDAHLNECDFVLLRRKLLKIKYSVSKYNEVSQAQLISEVDV
jgi:hypothetical protein